ncbi:MAG: VWA domain-containing protein [Fibrella sp.]|nr:VWA domain-containing protein [Armatimonadota bacterium]
MKRFRFSAALSLVLTLLPTGAFAADEATLPPTPSTEEALVAKETPVVSEESAPVVDLVFCIDVSGSMRGYMPVLKATIVSLIQRTVRQHPGHTVRLGLVRYGDGAKRYFVLDLSENQPRFLQHLQDTASDMGGAEFVGDVVKKSTEELSWSKNAAARRLYVLGNESALQGPVSLEEAIKSAREKSVTVSAAYCAFPTGRSQGSDQQDVRNWFGSEWKTKSTWIEVARLGGGEFMQIVSQRGNILPGKQPLLAVAWDPAKALRFADYLTGPTAQSRETTERFQGTIDRLQIQNTLRSLGVRGATVPVGSDPLEAGVMRYYDQNPQDATYLIRL